MKDFDTIINEWMEDGGVLWAEEDATWPHAMRLYTTNDEGVIDDMFAAYDGDLTRSEWEKWLCRSALSVAGYTDEEIEAELATW